MADEACVRREPASFLFSNIIFSRLNKKKQRKNKQKEKIIVIITKKQENEEITHTNRNYQADIMIHTFDVIFSPFVPPSFVFPVIDQ